MRSCENDDLYPVQLRIGATLPSRQPGGQRFQSAKASLRFGQLILAVKRGRSGRVVAKRQVVEGGAQFIKRIEWHRISLSVVDSGEDSCGSEKDCSLGDLLGRTKGVAVEASYLAQAELAKRKDDGDQEDHSQKCAESAQ
jgi:hypothetical protein